MKIIIGKYSGFCNGVKYTVDKANEVLDGNEVIYSLGDIVHNEIVIEELNKKGLIVKNNISLVPNNSKLIIRAHGEGIETYKKAQEKNIEIIDLTCGKVKLIHNKILNKKDDYFIIIIGKKTHPEAIAHATYSDNSFIVEDNDDINLAYQRYKKCQLSKVYIVSQTTFNEEKFDLLCDEIKKLFNCEILIDKTICNATFLRQEEVKDIAKNVNKMIIVGGKNSSNTKELETIAKKYCQDVYLIQNVNDLKEYFFSFDDIIGIEGGASTPKSIIDDVERYLQAVK